VTTSLATIFDASPHLHELAEKVHGTTELEASALPAMGDAVAEAIATLQAAPLDDEAAIMTALRLAKQRASLAIALADRLGQSTVDQTTQALSALPTPPSNRRCVRPSCWRAGVIVGLARPRSWKAIVCSAWASSAAAN
jgi:glutamine synthetase adenylyltransferase